VVTGLAAQLLLGSGRVEAADRRPHMLICWSFGLLRRTTVGGRLGWGAAAPAGPWRRCATVQGRRRGGGLLAGDEVAAMVLGGCRQEKRCAACSRGGVEMFRAKALHRSCRCRQQWRPSVIFLLGDACRGVSSTPSVVALREKSQAMGSQAGVDGVYVVSFLKASSRRARTQRWACFFYCRHGSGCRGSGLEWRTCESRRRPRRPCWATASWGGEVACMDWVAILCR
jgi:hypothetical protein